MSRPRQGSEPTQCASKATLESNTAGTAGLRRATNNGGVDDDLSETGYSDSKAVDQEESSGAGGVDDDRGDSGISTAVSAAVSTTAISEGE